MKKIGILTYHNAINYGAVLQGYALSKFLKMSDYSVEFINYSPKQINNIYSLYHRGLHPKRILKNILINFPISKMYKKRINDFVFFKQKCLPISLNRYSYNDDMEVLNDKYDVILCGSDQIWNTNLPDCDDIYFLPIKHKARKITYAASMGNDDYLLNARCDEEFKGWINDFDVISIREKSGCDKISKFLNNDKPIYNDIDPTLLLEKKYFEEIQSERIVEGDYVFMYSVKFSKDILKFAKFIAKKTGLPVYSMITTSSSHKFVKFDKSYVKILPNHQSPTDFLSYFCHAKYTFSDSFHGVAFSIIYNKQFYAINELKENDSLSNDERIVNILSRLNLIERYVSQNDFENIDFSQVINYEPVEKKLEKLRKESQTRLIASIEGK